MGGPLAAPFFACALFMLQTVSAAVDTIAANKHIRDGETVVSDGEFFELGFFSPGNSKNRYLGIWYYKISPQTVVWVANKETPLTNTSGMFRVSSKGNLLLLSGDNTVIWSSNSSVSFRNIQPVAQLLDTGNLIVTNGSNIDHLSFIWQSFDYIGDTVLSGMKFGKDFVTGRERQLTSWKSLDDPSPGLYVNWMDTSGYPQVFQRRGSVLQYRFGPWNGLRLSGFPSKMPNPFYTYEFVFNQMEVYIRYELVNSSFHSRVYLSPEGNEMRLNWIDPNQGWIPYLATTVDMCAQYGLCGPYGSCNINNSPVCSCMEGFEPLHPEEWNRANWSSGCQHKTPLRCGNGDGFRKISGVKLPDTRHSWYNVSMSLGECYMACQMNCSCTAYANLDIRRGGSGCLLWFGNLMDIREFEENQDLYVRMASSELAGLSVMGSGSSKKKVVILVLSISVGLVLVGLTVAVYAYKKKRYGTRRPGNEIESFFILVQMEKSKHACTGCNHLLSFWCNLKHHFVGNQAQALDEEDFTNGSANKDAELPLFSLAIIAKYTNHFSIHNKLGEGGFGPVYKGVLEDGQEIAVKRLSETSTQGFDEFKNEIRCVAKLQHRNLVKLLGYCAQGNEIMLIYEYMPNRSLDTIIFDETRSSKLDWAHRFCIIHGIARGLLYLHQDSRLRIIHRDLKASNILLDKDMNPKISDFGLARRFRGYETGASTKNVVGTYGYISPEYAVHGLFSVKSDVFSFGVLVLEIVAGMKNRGFSHKDHNDNLLGHAWRLYKDNKAHELVSVALRDSCINSEVLRSVHIGLLCVQNHAEDRPTMSSVVLMLGSEGVLPSPKPPAFFSELESNSSSKAGSVSVNEVTITSLDAR